MKGEFTEDQNHHHHRRNYNNNSNDINNSNNYCQQPMFPKFPSPHLRFPPHASFPFPTKESDHHSPPPNKPKIIPASAEDGGSVEISRRPRGRPPGSKNKPKPPVLITREPDQPAMAPYILELPAGCDVIESLTRFTRHRGVGICVLTASGTVANVTLRQPSTAAPGSTLTCHGKFDILSLSAVSLARTVPFLSGNCDFAFRISLGGPQGQIVGGIVVGPLFCASSVYVVATSFNSPGFHGLPLDEDDDEERQNAAVGGGDGRSSSPVSGGRSSGGGVGGHMGLYGCHVGSSSSDVIWTPTPTVRAPHPLISYSKS